MLDIKKHRLDYGAMLIPPPGFRLTKAVAATYSLDLNTLLSIPVALFFSQTLEGNFEAERVQLLKRSNAAPTCFVFIISRAKFMCHGNIIGYTAFWNRVLSVFCQTTHTRHFIQRSGC